MKKKKIYDGKILGLDVYDLTIRGRKVRREIIKHRGAAAMLVIDSGGKVILVKQHRFPRGEVLEIPAGTLEKGEKPLKCAHRELIEETGYKAKKMEQRRRPSNAMTRMPNQSVNRSWLAFRCFYLVSFLTTFDLSTSIVLSR